MSAGTVADSSDILIMRVRVGAMTCTFAFSSDVGSGSILQCWSRLIGSGPSERRQHERRQLRSKRRQREFIPSRLDKCGLGIMCT